MTGWDWIIVSGVGVYVGLLVVTWALCRAAARADQITEHSSPSTPGGQPRLYLVQR